MSASDCNGACNAVQVSTPIDELALAGPATDIAATDGYGASTEAPVDTGTVGGRLVSSASGDVVAAVIAELEARRTKRDAHGRYVKDSAGALVDGRRSGQLLNGLAAPKRELVEQATADGGVGADGPAVTLGRLRDAWAETSLLRESVFHTMAGQPTSAKGHARRLLGAYLQLVDRELRLATAIGLERRARSVPSLADFLATDAEQESNE